MKNLIKHSILLFLGSIFFLTCVTVKSHGQIEKDDWQIKSPNKFGLNQKLLSDLSSQLESGTFGNTHDLVIIKNGHLVFEHYGEGHQAKDLHYTASISKSVGSILFGLTMDNGLIPNLSSGITQKPLSSLLPEYKDLLSGQKSEILLKHVLSMTSNLDWDEQSFPYNDSRNDWYNASIDSEPVRYAFSKKSIGKPGAQFMYNGGMSITLSYMVDKALDIETKDFAEVNLFNPLDIKEYQWRNLTCGLLDFDGGLSLRPRDMAKIGQLMLNLGSWNDQQILSKEWVDESTTMQVKNIGMPDYGYQWWGGNYNFYENSTTVFLASGHGGQMIFVAPEFDMVVVITQEVFNNPMGEVNCIGLLANYILPSAKNPVIVGESHFNENKEDFAGNYSFGSTHLEIKLEDGELVAIGGDGSRINMKPMEQNRFIGHAIDIIPVYFEFIGNKCLTRFVFQNQEYTQN